MLKKIIVSCVALCCVVLFGAASYAANSSSPAGNWLAIDDKTHKPRGVVTIISKTNANGQVELIGYSKFGFYIPGYTWSKYYTGTYKPFYHKRFGQFPILWGYVSSGNGKWSKGHIFDADHSKLYRSNLQLLDNGNKLKVSGCIAFICRGQIWSRLNKEEYDSLHAKSLLDLQAHPYPD